MSIKDFKEKIKSRFDSGRDKLVGRAKLLANDRWPADIFIIVAFVLVAVISFGLGKLSSFETKRPPLIFGHDESLVAEIDVKGQVQTTVSSNSTPPNGQTVGSEVVVASKTGKKYHYPWCAGAKQISEANKITFQTFAAAKAAGYEPASNCPGLK
ncbi:MAG: hypothetical protein WCF94_03330 [bacterium]